MSLRCPRVIDWSRFPTRERLWRLAREKAFVLDGAALQNLASQKTLPHLWDALPPYNSQSDPHACAYFQNPAVRALLRKTGQDKGGTSTNGWIVDYHYIYGPEQRYLNHRNCIGSGHSQTLSGGHSIYLSDVLPFNGYNGRFGYRRNIPSLRAKSSSFGEVTPFSLH
ncbi:sperm microtubule associated protein 1 [Pelodytes ibericus]